MHGKGASGWIRSYIGGLTLLFGRRSRGLPKFPLLGAHTRLHLSYLFRAMTGRTAKPIRSCRILRFNVSAPATDLLAFLLQTVFMRRDYEFACKKADPVIVDCGSNIGMSVLWFKKRYPDAQITAFEPSERAFGYLSRNVEANHLNDVTLHRKAVAGKTEIRTFFTDADDDANLGASLTNRLAEHANRTVKSESVECVALSSIVNGEVDILKIDVEGAEQEVLEDLKQNGVLPRVSEMFVEYHYNPCNPGNRLIDILNILEHGGFDVVVDSKRLPPYPDYTGKSYKCNLYASRRESAHVANA